MPEQWQQFPCRQCGSTFRYSVDKALLLCDYCGHTEPLPDKNHPIVELDFRSTLQGLDQNSQQHTKVVSECPECGARFELEANLHADSCEFCGTSMVSETRQYRQLAPQAILPFSVTQEQAASAFKHWVNQLWFAPTRLKNSTRKEEISGIYQPYWTFDSQSEATYHGERGTYYQVPQRVAVVVNGRREVQTRMVTKVRWTPVSGQVQHKFDDVLVIGSKSLPEKITARLKTWNLAALKSYQAGYVSGFKSEMYQISPEEGLEHAKKIMDSTLKREAKRDIGGDLQRIHSLKSAHDKIHFKHILLPIWAARYTFGDNNYRFVVNGQTGEVQGERPYSKIKIIFTALLAIAIFIVGLSFLELDPIALENLLITILSSFI